MPVRSIKLEQAAELVERETTLHDAARRAGYAQSAWQALECAHILAQPFFGLRLPSHGHMLGFAIALGDPREAGGQIFRLALVPLGTLTGAAPSAARAAPGSALSGPSRCRAHRSEEHTSETHALIT